MPSRCLPLIALLAALAGCGGDAQPKASGRSGPGAGGPPPQPEVEVVTVTRGDVLLTPELPGRVEALRTAQVRARVEGIVEKRLFAEGSEVKIIGDMKIIGDT